MKTSKPKRVFIIHGWDGFPEEGWFPWLKTELTKLGFVVVVPQLPDAGTPRIETWVPAIAKAVGRPDTQTFFVCHSMGCQATIRYLARLPDDQPVGGAVFVGGFLKRLTNLEDAETEKIAHDWLSRPIDCTSLAKILPHSIALFSDDDYYVPLDNKDEFSDRLGSTIVVEHKKGHFSGSDGVTELPAALTAVKKLATVSAS